MGAKKYGNEQSAINGSQEIRDDIFLLNSYGVVPLHPDRLANVDPLKLRK